MSSSILTAPLDVLKTRLQSNYYTDLLLASRRARNVPPPSQLPPLRQAALHIRETFQILFAIPRTEGPRALFKGLGPNLVGVVPARAINFYVYGNGKKLIANYLNNGRESSWVHVLAAANAGIVTGTATCPIWVIKTRLQLDRSRAEKAGQPQAARRYKNAWDCVRQTLKGEGVRGIYRGLGASYLGVSESTLQWVLYERMKTWLAAREASLYPDDTFGDGNTSDADDAASRGSRSKWATTIHYTSTSAAAGLAKLVAALATYPHEVVRTRLRHAPGEGGRMKYNGIVQCFRLVVKEEGFGALYGGLVPHMLRVVPSAAVMFGCYEGVLKVLGEDSGV